MFFTLFANKILHFENNIVWIQGNSALWLVEKMHARVSP